MEFTIQNKARFVKKAIKTTEELKARKEGSQQPARTT